MSWPVFMVPAGDVIPIFFTSYDGATGASEAISGLAVTDIEVYKDGSITQRSSDNGYALIDTDGIDVDGVVGLNGFTIDTGDNSDASFYTVGAWFTVVVASVTADAQTVNFIAAQFRIMEAETTAGRRESRVASIANDAITAAATAADFGTEIAAAVAAPTAAVIADAVWDEDMTAHQTQGSAGQVIGDTTGAGTSIVSRLPAALVSGRMDSSAGAMAANVLTAAATAADFLTELQTGLANATDQAAIKAKTDNLPSDPADASVVAGLIAAVPAALLAEVVDGVTTLLESIRLWNAALGGESSGLETATAKYRDLADTKDRITATVDADGNRSAVTRDLA